MHLNALAIALVAGVAHANAPAPVSFDPGDWLGIDGNWSTIKFLLGSAPELVNVLVSTSLSEFWAIGPGGCVDNEPHCAAARGGIYTPLASKHWSPMGIWQLGLDYLGCGGNGQYGLDTVNAYSSITNIGFGMSNVLMSAINMTDYYIGMFGLGITQGTFGEKVAQSPLTQAVETFGWIPSYSYGYTAGAHYRNMPVSITIGGYDIARYVPHDINFTLTPQDNGHRALVRGIQVAANGTTPKHWDARTNILSSWNSSFTALIDSTTPYLWLPEDVCDHFAKAFNLTYNSTFDLYTVTDDQYNDYTSLDSFTFTFSLTSFDNHDNFGSPLDIPGLVNITVPMTAFVSLLQYPFKDQAIQYGDPAVPYFSLRKAYNSSSIVIGRSFLQEAYLITRYDEACFSVYQAKFPSSPAADAQLAAIRRPNNSPYPPPPSPGRDDNRLGAKQMVGIAIGATLIGSVCFVSVCWFCRRGKARRETAEAGLDETKDSASTVAPDSPRTPVSRMLYKIARQKRSQRVGAKSADTKSHPLEAPDSEIYELPAPMPPVELDGSDSNSIADEALLGTDDTHNLSAYELARRKIDRQLRGPVPGYSPPMDSSMPLAEKKMANNIDPAPITPLDLPREEAVPISPIKTGSGTDSLPRTLPSPISPHTEDGSFPVEMVSPVTAPTPTKSPPTSGLGSVCYRRPSSRPTSASDEPRELARTSPWSSEHSNALGPPLPAMTIQRSSIDPTNIVCVGLLPQDLQSLRQSIMMAYAAGQGRRTSHRPRLKAESYPSEQSLGSNYTDEEDRMMQEMARQATPSYMRLQGQHESGLGSVGHLAPPLRSMQTPSDLHWPKRANKSGTTPNEERMDGTDFVHIPQLADKRYSWEEE